MRAGLFPFRSRETGGLIFRCIVGIAINAMARSVFVPIVTTNGALIPDRTACQSDQACR